MKKTVPLVLLANGLFFVLDQYFKFVARTSPEFTLYLWKPWLGWEYFENLGIAFSAPVPQIATLLLTPIIVAMVLVYAYKKRKQGSVLLFLGVSLIITGALSNLVDRLLLHVTIDYLRVLTMVINVADVMIVSGAGIVLLSEKRNKIQIPRDN